MPLSLVTYISIDSEQHASIERWIFLPNVEFIANNPSEFNVALPNYHLYGPPFCIFVYIKLFDIVNFSHNYQCRVKKFFVAVNIIQKFFAQNQHYLWKVKKTVRSVHLFLRQLTNYFKKIRNTWEGKSILIYAFMSVKNTCINSPNILNNIHRLTILRQSSNDSMKSVL